MARRPSQLTPELAHKICRLLSTGQTLRQVCRGKDMPAESTVREWALDDLQGFAAQYARAREIGYHGLFDEMREIADNPVQEAAAVNRDRLKVDTRKWMLSKALPKIYGDRLEVANKHEVVEKPLDPDQQLTLYKRIAFSLASGLHLMEAHPGDGGTVVPLRRH